MVLSSKLIDRDYRDNIPISGELQPGYSGDHDFLQLARAKGIPLLFFYKRGILLTSCYSNGVKVVELRSCINYPKDNRQGGQGGQGC